MMAGLVALISSFMLSSYELPVAQADAPGLEIPVVQKKAANGEVARLLQPSSADSPIPYLIIMIPDSRTGWHGLDPCPCVGKTEAWRFRG